MIRNLLILGGLLGVVAVRADVIPLTTFSSAYGGGFNGFAYDSATETFYSHAGYGYPSTQPVKAYTSEANFAAGTSSSSMTIPNTNDPSWGSVSPPTGTYFVVDNGILYGRPDASSNTLAMWNASNGAFLGSATYPGIGGANFTETFNWGGFSGLNLYNDNGSLYMLGSTGSNWDILSLAPDLSVTRTLTTSFTTLGYAFVINGELFASDSFTSNNITHEVDLATGAISTVNYTFTGIGGPYYSDMFYDSTSDQLFVWDTNSNQGKGLLYDTSNASVLFNAPAAVPEPTSVLLLAGILAALTPAIRRRIARASETPRA